MSYFSITSLTAYATSLIAVIAFIVQRRKYAKSIANTLGLESFVLYVTRALGYRILLHLRPWAAARFSLRDFAFNRLESTPSTVHVPAPVQVNVSIDSMFVPLTATSSERERISAQEIARPDFRRVILIGDPGSGKSTVIRKLYRDFLRTSITSPVAGMLPVLIELKNLEQFPRPASQENEQTYLFDILERDVGSVKTYSSEDLFKSFAESGNLVVLLDGLDEVRTQDLDDVWQDIVNLGDQLARLNSKNKLIVTTRRQLYVNLPDYFLSAFDDHLTLQGFTPDEIYQFLTKWEYDRERNVNIARLFRNLATQPNIQNMCSTPLILAMYVALDQITGGDNLPETRPDFYKNVTDELLIRRRSRQLGLTTGLNMLRRTRQQILGLMALEHMLDLSQSRNNLRWENAVNVIERVEHISRAQAEVRLRELSRDTGLFTEERKEESIRFIHLTFCEFFAGQIIANGRSEAWEQITAGVMSNSGDSSGDRLVERFAEVIVFAAALETNQSTRQERVRWAAKSDSLDIALKVMVDCQAYDDSVVLLQLDKIATEIANTSEEKYNDDIWLHNFQQVAITLRDMELVLGSYRTSEGVSVETFFRMAVHSSTDIFQKLFLFYLRLDTAAAMAMSRAMGPKIQGDLPKLLVRALDEADVLTYVLSEFNRGGNVLQDWAPVLALGALTHPSLPLRLLGEVVDERLKSEIEEQGTRHSDWYNCWAVRESLLGYVFAAGCRWPGSSETLQVMARMPVRRNKIAELILNVSIGEYLAIVSPLIIFFYFFISLNVASNNDDSNATLEFLFALSVVYLLFFLIAFASVTISTLRQFPPSQLLLFSGGSTLLPSDKDVDSFYRASMMPGGTINSRLFYQLIRRSRTAAFTASRILPTRSLPLLPAVLRISPNSKLRIFAILGTRAARIEAGRDYGADYGRAPDTEAGEDAIDGASESD